MMTSKVRPAWVGRRPARTAERVRPVPFLAPLPAPVLLGFPALRTLGGADPFRASRFLASVADAPLNLQRLAATVARTAADGEAWQRALAQALELSSPRLLVPLSLAEAALQWRQGGLRPEVARLDFLKCWEAVSRRLPEPARGRNLLDAHRLRYPHLWKSE